MNITREQLVKKLSTASDFHQKDVRKLLKCLDDVVLECFSEVTDDEDVSVQLITGMKASVHVVPERQRVDPRNGEQIVCKATVKPACKFSEDFRQKIQDQYEESRDD